MTIRERIKQRRKALDMSVDDLAAHIGKSRATIYRYENGDIESLPIDILIPIADALNVTPAYLLGWEDSSEKLPVPEFDPRHIELINLFERLDESKKNLAIELLRSMV